jgi:hypothetical protein
MGRVGWPNEKKGQVDKSGRTNRSKIEIVLYNCILHFNDMLS